MAREPLHGLYVESDGHVAEGAEEFEARLSGHCVSRSRGRFGPHYGKMECSERPCRRVCLLGRVARVGDEIIDKAQIRGEDWEGAAAAAALVPAP